MTEQLDENNLKALVSLLSDDDIEVLTHVEEKIITLGGTVIPYLEKEWESNFNPIVQKRIEDLIHTVQFGQLKTRLLHWKEHNTDDLLEGMWIIATYQYPDYELAQLKADIDQLYYVAWVEMKNLEATPYEKIRVLNSVFFDKLRFVSNTKNFHSVSNSMINQVLDTRKGNPISLCVIYMTIAQRLDLPIYGVNLPNLFILTYKEAQTQFYINAFNKGLIFSREDIDNYVSHLNLASNKLFYEPCNHLDIVRRVLRNMLISYEKASDEDRAEEVKQLMDLIKDESDTGFLTA